MQRIVSRSVVRRLQHHVARTQTEACRSLSSTTTTTLLDGISSTARGRPAPTIVAACTVSSHNNTTTITSTTTVSATHRGYSSNTTNNNDDDNNTSRSSSSSEFRRAYVHPLSQVVLEYLQDCHHSWIVSRGLDRSLTLHRDGSFEAKCVLPASDVASPLPPPRSVHTNESPHTHRSVSAEPVISASTSAMATMRRDQAARDAAANTAAASPGTNSGAAKGPPFQELAATTTTDNTNTNTHDDTTHSIDTHLIRIWTSFDEQEKKHWLTVRKGLFRQRFLLQDNLLTAWQGNRGTSLPERIHVAVDEMIRAVDQQQQQQHRQWQQKGQRRFRKR